MKKFLALVLTLAMVLTLNVGMVVGAAAADAPIVDVTNKETVTIDDVVYTVIDDLTAVSTKGNYILSGDVAVALDAGDTLTFAAGTVLHGNGYTITVDGNDFESPLGAAPFVLEVGEAITITNVNFGTEEAPFVFQSEEPLFETDEVAELSIFASDVAPEEDEAGNKILEGFAGATALFVDVNFAFVAGDALNTDVSAVMATAWGEYTLDNCHVYCQIDAGDMNETDPTILTEGYAAGFFARVEDTAVATFNNCSTVFGSYIVNDYRIGGFVGKVDGGINISNSTNYAKLTNLCLVTGGFIGYVSGETLTDWTFNGNVNYGEITAYRGPVLTVDGKNTAHSDAGYSVGSMWGYIYKDLDNSAPKIVATDCINYGNVYGEDRLAGMFGDNRIVNGDWIEVTIDYETDDFGEQIEVKTETQKYEVKTPIYENCVNYGDVRCIVMEATPGAFHMAGGFVSRLKGPTLFKNCVNYGHIDAKGMKDSNNGGLVANSSDANAPVAKMNEYFAEGATDVAYDEVTVKVTYENCINYGLVENGRRIGGLVGTVEAQSEFINCVNFGTVISGTCTQSDTYAGGIAGFHDQNPVEFTNCLNFGKVVSGQAGGGILGYNRNNKYATVPARNEVVVTACFNFGDITCTDGSNVAGLVGIANSPITVLDSVNVGVIEATATARPAQLVGVAASEITVGDCMMFGSLAADSMPANYDGILEYFCEATVNVPEDAEFMAAIIGTEDDVTDERNVAVALDVAYTALSVLFGDSADMPLYKGETSLVFAYVALRGAQFSTEVADGKADLRFVGKAVNVEGATKVEFTYKVNDAEAVTVEGYAMETVYAVNAYESVETRTADTIGGDAMYAFVIEDIALEGEVTVEVTMVVTAGDATYTSETVTLTFVDGVAL